MTSTVERLATMEQQIKNIDEKLNGTNDSIYTLGKKLDDFTKAADKKYASKDTERAVKWLVGIIIGAVVIALIKLVILS